MVYIAYARYIKKKGKKFGPYYYKSVRDKNGKIRNIYLGKKPRAYSNGRKTNLFILFVCLGILIPLSLYTFSTFTGYFVAKGQIYTENLNLTVNASQDYTWNLQNTGELKSVALSGKITGNGTVKVYLEKNGKRYLILDSVALKEEVLNESEAASVTGLVVGKYAGESSENNTDNLTETVEPVNGPTARESTELGNETETQNITLPLNETNGTIPVNETVVIAVPENVTNVTLPENVTIEENITEELNITKVIIFENICIETCSLTGFNESSYKLVFEIEPGTLLKIDEINYSILEEVEEVPTNLTNVTELNITPVSKVKKRRFTLDETVIQHQAEIGKPVKWVKKIKLDKPTANISVELPKNIENVKIRKVIAGKKLDMDIDKIKLNKSGKHVPIAQTNLITGYVVTDYKENWFTKFLDWLRAIGITGLFVYEVGQTSSTELVIEEEIEEIEIEYYTEAPQAIEEEISRRKKQIIITGPDDIHYTDILAYTFLPAEVSNEQAVKLYWLKDIARQEVSFDIYDTNDNNKIDYIEWVVPNLSDQTYELVIEISKAEHLDSNREFIEDVYEEVKARDGLWKEISAGHYVRATFRKNLTSDRDITIYARSSYPNSRIEVYEKDKDELIADFGVISEDKKYRVLLTNLEGSRDTFDLKVSGGAVEFDYIVDPSGWANSSFDRCMNITISNAGSSTLTNFPAYINLTYDSDMLSDYSDLRFYSAGCNNGGAQLDYEIENYTASKADIWVRIPSLPSSGTNISVYYKNNTAISSGENPTGVWNSNYKGVWHMTEVNATDSTQYGNNGTEGGGVTFNSSGKIDGSDDSDGVDDRINANNDTSLNVRNNITLEAWIYPTSYGGYAQYGYGRVIDKDKFALFTNGIDTPYNNYSLVLYIVISGTPRPGQTPADSISLNTWQHVVATYNGSDVKIDINGVNQTVTYPNGQPSGDIDDNSGYDFLIGNRADLARGFNGTIDEVRISNTTRSADWINQSYQMVIDQSNYAVFGDEERRNYAPTHSTPILNSTSGNNYTTDNITCYNQSTYDADGDAVTNIYNWYRNGSSITVLNMPFDTNTTSTTAGAVKDYSGYENNGTIQSALTWESSDGCMSGGCYYFDRDASNKYIEIPDSGGTLSFLNFTVSAWIKVSDVPVDDDYYIVSQSSYCDGTNNWILGLTDDAGKNGYLRLDIMSGGTNTMAYSSSAFNDGDWHHVAGVRNSTDIYLYVDGVFAGINSDNTPGQVIQSSANITIGSGDCITSEDLNGSIDEVRIYNHSLSGEQIYQLYIEGKNNYTNATIVSSETSAGENWICSVTPNDATEDGITLNSSTMSITATLTGTLPRHTHLTWRNGTATDTTMVISWREGTENDTESTVFYDTTSRNCDIPQYNYNKTPESIQMSDTSDFIRHTELTNLTPNTLYYFCINNSAGNSSEYSFRTAPSNGTNFTWIMGADTKEAISTFETLAGYAMAFDPLFVMYAGDAPSSGIDSDWSGWFNATQESFVTTAGRMVPIIHALANHELSSDADASFWYDYYEFPNNELYFYHDIGDVRVVTLFSPGTSSGLSSITDPAQLTFINQTLEEAYNDSKWIVTQYHQPIYPSYRSPDGSTQDMKDYWLPAFDKYHVHLSSEAHDHVYKRTYPMYNNATTTVGNGTVYVGDGTWGQARSSVQSENLWALEYYKTDEAAIIIVNIPDVPFDINDNSTWMNVTAINDSNEEIDMVLIPKSSTNRAPTVTLNLPANNNHSVSLTGNITFSCSATDTDGVNGLANITLYTDLNTTGWSVVETKTLAGTSNSTTFTVNTTSLIGNNTFKDSTFKYNCKAYDTSGLSDWGNSNYTFSGWDLGSYTNTTLNTSDNYIGLKANASGQYPNTTGTYTSKIFNATYTASWNNITWDESLPYGEELPNNQYDELAAGISGGANMTGNVLLMHFNNDSSVGESYNNSNGSIIYDYSGLENNGTLYVGTDNSGNYSSTGGKFNGAYTFDGTDDYVTRAYDSDFDFGTGGFSVSGWFKTGGASTQYLVSRYDNDQGFKVWVESNGSVSFGIDDDSNWGPDELVISPSSYNDNNWHHFTAVKVNNSELELYVDGYEVASKTPSGITEQINADNDDAEEQNPPGGSMYQGSSDLEMPYDGSTEQIIGLYFTSVNVPQGVTITNAYIQFTGEASSAGAGSPTLYLYGDDADNAAAIGSGSGNLSNRANTDAIVSWSPPAWSSGSAGANERSPDISSVIQEIVSRPGWSSGNDMVIMVNGTGGSSDYRRAESREGSPSGVALLIINHTLDLNTLSSDSAPLTIGSDEPTSANFFNGTIDEVAVWNRSLSATEILNLYKRGTLLRLNISARSCDDSACDTEGFTDFGSNATLTDISSLTNNQYFQYRLTFETDDVDYTPELDTDSVTVKYELLQNTAPTHSTPGIVTSSGNNYTTDNITCYNQSTYDADGDAVTNIYNWYRNGSSITVLNMPFDTNTTSTTAGAVKDYSGYDNNGTLGGGTAANVPAWNSSSDCIRGGCYSFDGIDDFIEVADPADDSLDTGGNLTIVAWVKLASVPDTYTLVAKDYVYSEFDVEFRADELRLYHGNGTHAEGAYEATKYYRSGNWSVGVWYHVAVTRNNSTGEVKFYEDGDLKNTYPFSKNVSTSDYSVYIGVRDADLGRPFNGTIDELKIYPHTLTADQIYQLYIEGRDNYTNSTIVSNETSAGENWTCSVTPNDATEDGITLNSSTMGITAVNTAPTVTLNLPTNNNNSVSLTDNITFNCSATDTDGVNALNNITIYTDLNTTGWSVVETKTLTGTSNSTTFTVNTTSLIGNNTFKDSTFKYNCKAYDTRGLADWGNSNYTFSGWDLGNYNKSFFNTTNNFIGLTANDTEQELPDSMSNDGYISMTGNVLLLHFNNDSAYGENDTYAYDFSGNGNNLSCSSCPTFSTSTSKLGGAFDYSGDSFTIASPTGLGFTGSFTVSFWARPDQISVIDILGKRTSDTNGWFFYQNNGIVRFRYGDGGTSYDTDSSAGTMSVGTWVHVVGVHDTTNNIDYIYINGGESGKETSRTADSSSAGGFMVGGTDPWPGDWDGKVDEVAAWNRSLSVGEVLNIYNRQKGIYIDRAEYKSKIFDAGSSVSWKNVTWDEGAPYDEELPANEYDELDAGISGGANMTGNVLLMHFNNDSTYGENDTLVYDFSGMGNNGTCSGTECPAFNSTGGKLGGAYFFNESQSNAFNVSDSPELRAQNFTFLYWLKPNSFGDSTYDRVMFHKGGTGSSSDIWIGFDEGTTLRVCLDTPSFTCLYWGINNFTLNVWQLVAITKSGTSVTVYKDGESIETQTANSGNIGYDSNLLVIGKERTIADSHYDGYMDEIAIFNRSLSAQEILNIYKRGALRLNISARSCDDANCDTETFTDFGSNATLTDISSLTDNQYFQYKLTFETDDANYTPQLNASSVIVGYDSEVDSAPNVTLNSPPSDSWNASQSITFAYTPWDDYLVVNCSLWTNESGWSKDEDNASSIANGSVNLITHTFSADGPYLWNVECYDNASTPQANSSLVNYTIKIDSAAPAVTLPLYTNATQNKSSGTIDFDIYVSDGTSSPSHCKYNFAGGSNTTVAASSGWCNITGASLSGLSGGNNTINAWANDSVDNWGLNDSYVVWINSKPAHATPLIQSTSGNNLTTDNITCYNQSTSDGDGDTVTNIYNWYRNGTSIMALNMPFDTNTTSTTAGAVKDYSGFNNNGTISDITHWNSSADCIKGGCYTFDGSNDFIDLGDDLFNSNLQGTVSFWAKVNSWPTEKPALYIGDDGVSNQFLAFAPTSSAGPRLQWYGGTSTTIQGDTSLSLGEWYFFTFTSSGSTYKIYKDGIELSLTVQEGSNHGNWIGDLGGGTKDYYIGKWDRSTSGPFYFNGTLDEVKMYNISLTADQIYQLYIEGLNNYTNSTITSSETSAGENWTCSVTPNDATEDGTTKNSSALTITNTAPTTPTEAILNDTTLYTNDPVSCTGSGSTDDDGDSITYWYKWNDTSGTLEDWSTDNVFSCTTSGCDKGDTLYCYVLASDGSLNSSGTVSNSTTILNTQPNPDSSMQPSTTHNLLQSMSWTEGSDVDGDSVTSWYCVDDDSTGRDNNVCDAHPMTSGLDSPHAFESGELTYGGASKTYYGRLIASDGEDNSTNYDFTFTLTNTQPSAPSSASLAGQTTNDTTPTITFTKGTDSDTDPSDTVTQYVSVDSSGYTDSGDTYTTSGDINQFTVTPELSDGTYYVRQWADDNTGASNSRSNNYEYTFTVSAVIAVESITIKPDEGDPGTIINPMANSNKTVNVTIVVSNTSRIDVCEIRVFNSSKSYNDPVFHFEGSIQNCGSTCDCFQEWDMEYWRNSGDWNVSVYINLTTGTGNFTSQNFTYNELTSITVNTSTITFTGIPGQTVNSSDAYPLGIKNTGNMVVNISINGTNFQGLSDPGYVVGVGNATYNETTSGVFQGLTNDYVQIFDNHQPAVTKNLFFRAYLPVGFIRQDYQNIIEITS